MRLSKRYLRKRSSRGLTLIELLISISILGGLMFSLSMIYFSCLKVYLRSAWKLPPYDEATMSVQEMSRHLKEAMLIESYGPQWLIVAIPRKDANGDNVLVSDGEHFSLVAGRRLAFYISDETGSFDAEGDCLWMAIQEEGAEGFTPRKLVGENIHPELNPTDPDTGLVRPMFTYWPDETRLWGVEMWVTSTSTVHGEQQTQTAHSETYLRNL